MIFSCGISGSSPGRKLIVSDNLPSEDFANRSLSSQTYRSSSAASTSSPSPSRSDSPAVRVEDITTGKWTRISSRVSVRPLTPSEAESVFERQRRRKRESRKGRSRMEDHDETRSSIDGGGTINIPTSDSAKELIPESPGSRSNYGEFYWDEFSRDTSGENNYHNTSSFEDDLLDFERGAAVTRLDRTQDDLNKFRQRIDNNVEQQKEYSEMMAALQNKVHEYRKHIAELEGKMVSARRRQADDGGFTILDSNVFQDTSNSFRDIEMWSPARTRGAATNIVVAGDPNANYEMIARLDEERRRADEYRMQWENERTAKERLEDENERLRREFDRYDREYRDKERTFVNRERNLAQYLSDEQKKMMDMWTELQRVRKQFAELKDQTERDLDTQRNEFNRVLRNVSNITRTISVGGGAGGVDQAGGVSGPSLANLLTDLLSTRDTHHATTYDTTIIEAVKRYRDRAAAGDGGGDRALLEELKAIRGTGGSEGDAELQKELMLKYEESIERNIELESKGDESQRKIADLEAELRRTKDKLNDSTNALRKMHEISQDHERLTDGSQKRTRSLSPGKSPLPPSEALRSVRNALRNRDNDIQQLERKLKISESQVKEFMNKFETADETRRRLDKQLADAKREISNQQKQIDELERNLRRAEDKLRASESERQAADKARKFLEEELARLQASYQKSTTDDVRKIRDELDEQNISIVEDHKNRWVTLTISWSSIVSLDSCGTRIPFHFFRINELNRRVENLLRENNKLKTEMAPLKDKFRDMETEYNNTLRRLDEKDSQIKYIEEIRRNIQRDLDDQRNRNDLLATDHDKLTNDLENALKTAHLAEQQLKELKGQRDDYQKQKDELSRQLFDIRHKFETERKTTQDLTRNEGRFNDEIEKLKQTIDDYERQVMLLRRHNDEFDTTIKNLQGKITQLENEVRSRTSEVEKLNDLNQKLQKEKQEIMNQKNKADTDIQTLKETIRKLEQELEKLRNENKALEVKEERARDAHNQQLNRANLLAKELEDSKHEIHELNDKIRRLEEEIRDLRDRIKGVKDTTKPRGPYKPTRAGDSVEGDEITIPGGTDTDRTTTIDRTTIIDRYHDDLLSDLRIKEINDKWKMQLEKLENEKDDLERRIRELEDELAQIGRGNERQENDVSELKRKHAVEIDKLRSEISSLHDKHLSDLDDEKEQYAKAVENLKVVEEDLREKVRNLEKQLADALNRENDLERELRDSETKISTLVTQNQKMRDDMEDLLQKWKTDAYQVRSEAKALETTNTGLKAQLQAANDRIEHLNKTVNDSTNKIRDLTSQVRRLEEELTDTKSTLAQKESDLETTTNRLRSIEEQYAQLQIDASKWRSELDTVQRENDVLRSANSNMESELARLKNRLKVAEDTLKELKNSLNHVKAERERLQNAYRDKAKQADHLQQLSQQFDSKLQKLRQELQTTSDKLITSDTERTALRNELTKLQQELKFGAEQMQRKTDEYQSTLDDLANAHRVSEDGRLNALQELESRKYEISDLQSRLEGTEQRLITLQQDFINADAERDALADAMRRFQNSANRVINISRYTNVIDGGDAHVDGGRDVEIPRGSGAPLDDVQYPRSVPFPVGIDYTGTHTGAGGRVATTLNGTTTVNINDTVNVTQLEDTLQQLVGRIDKLELERNELRDALNRLRKKTSESHTTINKHETRYKTIEDNLNDIEEDKRALEARLASAKQLLRSQEEALKQRDEERRQMKSKMVAAELQARGKEAQLRHLNEQLKNLRTDLENAHADIRALRDREESWDASRFQLESKMREQDSHTQKLQMQISSFESERQSLMEKVKELDGALRLSETKVQDMRDDAEKLKRDLAKAESYEIELRKHTELQSKSGSELQMLKDQLLNAQNDLSSTNTRKTQLESELLNLRSELRDYKQRVHDVNSRASELQRQLQDSNSEKNRLEDRILTMEKNLNQQRTTENELRQQLDTAKNDKRAVSKELEELKRLVAQLENDRRANSQLLENWKKDKFMLQKKIEMLETEKRRTEAAIRETALQREAIEKSLNAMERENKELYKNCAQLQQQIAQLEMENGNRILELTNKQRRRTRKTAAKNAPGERPDQIAILRDQLDGERRRRRDFVDRSLVNDIGRLGGHVLGIRSYGDSGLDNILHGGSRSVGFIPRSTFVSNPLTPPLGTSTPTHNRTLADYRDSTTSYSRRGADDTGSVYGGSVRDRDSVYGGVGSGGRDSVYGGRDSSFGRDSVREKDPSVVDIPLNRGTSGGAGGDSSMPSSLHSSMHGSRYDTLAPNRDDL
ncbi:M protein repeat protein [Ostertagia ostertagi]